jgi:hypothetical protein
MIAAGVSEDEFVACLGERLKERGARRAVTVGYQCLLRPVSPAFRRWEQRD